MSTHKSSAGSVGAGIRRLSLMKTTGVTAAVVAYTALWAYSVATEFSYNVGGWGLSFGLVTLPFVLAAPITAGLSAARAWMDFRGRRNSRYIWLALAIVNAASAGIMMDLIMALNRGQG